MPSCRRRLPNCRRRRDNPPPEIVRTIMDILYLLVPLSVLLVFAIGGLFWWALNHRQFDELDEAGEGIIDDVDTPDAAADTDRNPR